ncbi:arrestin domain-containing protein 3-like isoform X2 [Scleropages formosus]|uniref:arrestin domain-containing protein 3-like isoform X2 n=1 Tax=Scleropages formosus TaxID=113540 RepID=UPI0010FAB628|nr:arrestin domain-containing protein 3-like isoform X2 [Scleropages formosus]
MSSSVKSISISYDPINEQNTFSNGDVLTGWVVVVITKKTKIETLLVKVRGKAEVFWSESHGENTDYYHAKEKCLKLDQIILSRKKDENDIVLAPGNHVYQFAFQIPQGSLPSTFKGAHGSIQYKVEAKLSRSWRVPSRAKSPFTFQSKVDLCVQQLMSPQHETIRKKYNFLTSGIVNMNVNLDKSSYRQGDGLKVTVEVDNGTSREIAPKFCVTQKQNFYANGRRNLYMKKVVKAVGKPIPGKSQQMLVQVLDLPRDLSVSILNCKILKVEYKLRNQTCLFLSAHLETLAKQIHPQQSLVLLTQLPQHFFHPSLYLGLLYHQTQQEFLPPMPKQLFSHLKLTHLHLHTIPPKIHIHLQVAQAYSHPKLSLGHLPPILLLISFQHQLPRGHLHPTGLQVGLNPSLVKVQGKLLLDCTHLCLRAGRRYLSRPDGL